MSACFANKGFLVVGADVNPALVEAINEGRPPVFEPELAEHLATGLDLPNCDHRHRRHGRLDRRDVHRGPDAERPGRRLFPSVRPSAHASRSVTPCAREGLPPRRADVQQPAGLDRRPRFAPRSRKRAAKDAAGTSGSATAPSSSRSGARSATSSTRTSFSSASPTPEQGTGSLEIYSRLVENHAPVARMSFVNAELAKLSVNTFITTKIRLREHARPRLRGDAGRRRRRRDLRAR